MPTKTVENYLKELYALQQRTDGPLVAMGRLASALGVTPGTATTMVKALSEAGLVDYEPRTGVGLSRPGRRLALRVLRRHRLIELFLVEVLKLDWSEVHDEAEELEHAISDNVLDRIDALLGYPTNDPHGDPIPSAEGKYTRPPRATLADCAVDTPVRVARVADQQPDFLRFVDAQGLTPGVSLSVLRRDAVADSVTVHRDGGGAITVGTSAAQKIQVEKA
ncbi:MAG: MarR family transcriptional regulator [Phycisphaera sp.]|nr:MarR family transcriptional regulator [Phycisphaera sp.]